MRSLEIIIIIIVGMNLLKPIVRRLVVGKTIEIAALIGMGFFVLHLLLEGYRWQMLPVYLFLVISAISSIVNWRRQGEDPDRSILKAGMRLLLFLLILVPIVVFPVPNLQEPSGEYSVGTTILYMHDFSREEISTEDPSDTRELNVQIWYPATLDEGGVLSPYLANLELAGPAFADFLGLPTFVLNHVNLVKTHSILDAPLASAGSPFPVLIFSHGWGGTRSQSTFLMEELASHGYVIAAIDHPYGALVTVYPDGSVVLRKEEILAHQSQDQLNVQSAKELLSTWTGDVRFVLDQLETMNASSEGNLFTNSLDLEKVGFFGHSTGGGNAVQSCWVDTRCDAGLAMDAWLEPVAEEVIEDSVNQPFMFLWSEDWGSDENKALFNDVYDGLDGLGYSLAIAGTRHYDFSDLPLLSPLSPWLGLKGPIDGRRVMEIISAYSVAFFDEQLKDESSELLVGVSDKFTEVDFEMKEP